jgi:hypothetical protein
VLIRVKDRMAIDVQRTSAAEEKRRQSAPNPDIRAANALEEIRNSIQALRKDLVAHHDELIAAIKAIEFRR